MRLDEWRLPAVRLQPRTELEVLVSRAAQISAVILATLALVAALKFGKFLLAPVALALTIGLMLSPAAGRLERAGLPPAVSAALVTFAFIALVVASLIVFAVPFSTWLERLPFVWDRLRAELHSWREPLSAFSSLREDIRSAVGGDGAEIVVEEATDPVADFAYMAPSVIAQVLLFFASLYFFVATREAIRETVLGFCISRRARWRAARIFRDAEWLVSRYLASITLINLGLGATVGLAMMLLGMPSPFLWGALAGVLNYIVYIGPAITAAVITLVALASYDATSSIFVPPAAYLFINFLEAQFVTPFLLGRTLTLNPLVVFLAIAFWLWLWGAVGGFVAVPFLLVMTAVISHVFPQGQRARDGTKISWKS